MLLKEFIGSPEYHRQKRIAYSGRVPWNIKDIGSRAHKKAIKYWEQNLKSGSC